MHLSQGAHGSQEGLEGVAAGAADAAAGGGAGQRAVAAARQAGVGLSGPQPVRAVAGQGAAQGAAVCAQALGCSVTQQQEPAGCTSGSSRAHPGPRPGTRRGQQRRGTGRPSSAQGSRQAGITNSRQSPRASGAQEPQHRCRRSSVAGGLLSSEKRAGMRPHLWQRWSRQQAGAEVSKRLRRDWRRAGVRLSMA